MAGEAGRTFASTTLIDAMADLVHQGVFVYTKCKIWIAGEAPRSILLFKQLRICSVAKRGSHFQTAQPCSSSRSTCAIVLTSSAGLGKHVPLEISCVLGGRECYL